MNVLAIQLKRIGDLVLTTPALAQLKSRGARVTLVVDSSCASLLPAIGGVDERLVYSKKGGNRALWRRIRERAWDVCLDFTGSDRSALLGWISRTPRRITFQWVRKRLLRRLAYHAFVDSPVRLAHTCDHYSDLLRPLGFERGAGNQPSLDLPPDARDRATALAAAGAIHGGYVLLHPGTARPEKYWLAERWAAVIGKLHELGQAVVITCGPDAFEKAHAAAIERACGGLTGRTATLFPPDLPTLAALVEKARLIVSCDTAVVHLAAAFQQPQIALFGPTNPFHWRPRHERSVVISAAQPDAPLTNFLPKMAGAPMERIPVATVLRSAEALLSVPPHSSGSADRI